MAFVINKQIKVDVRDCGISPTTTKTADEMHAVINKENI